MDPNQLETPKFVRVPVSRAAKAIWIVLGACVLLLVGAVGFVGFFFMPNEPRGTGPTQQQTPPGSTLVGWLQGWTAVDSAMLGSDLPAGATVLHRYRDDRAPDALLLVQFTTSDAEAVRFAATVTGSPVAPDFSIQDLDTSWWKNRPATGRGSRSDLALSAIAKRVLLSDPDPNGITTVWAMANET
jgi:hypothetical protein